MFGIQLAVVMIGLCLAMWLAQQWMDRRGGVMDGFETDSIEIATDVALGLCSEVERLSQQLQDARAEIERQANIITHLQSPQPCGHPQATILVGEARGYDNYVHYCAWCADVARLREALEMVEWVDALYGNLCPWCLHSEDYGHDHCPRQAALEATE